MVFFIFGESAHAGWNRVAIGGGNGTPYGLDVGNSRNDGVSRVCLGSTYVYEFSYSGSQWNVKSSSTTSGLAGWKGVSIGQGRNDAVNRIYTPYSTNLFEYTWTGSSYTQTATVGIITGNSFSDVAVAPGRNDGINRVYAANYDGNIYEFTYNAGTWFKTTVGSIYINYLGGAVTVGKGRNDGILRVYAGGKDGLYEFTYSGGWGNPSKISSRESIYSITVSTAQNDNLNRVYIACSQGVYEYTFSAGNWQEAKLDDVGTFYDITIGRGKNDDTNRVYAAYNNGNIYQYSFSNGTWYRGTMSLVGMQSENEIVVGNGRNDGTQRIYATNTSDYNVYEFAWSGVDDIPTVSFTGPFDGQIVSEITPVTVDANDDIGILKVEYYIDNAIQFTANSRPFKWDWDTSGFSNTSHTLKAKVYDTIGQTATSQIAVTVTRPPTVSLTNPASNSTISGTLNVTASATDDVSVNRVEFYVNSQLQNTDYTAPYSWSWNTTNYADGDYTLGATAYDGAGYSSSTFISVKIKNNVDSPPLISLTNPVGGQTVTGNVDISASANDDVGISKVEFYIDDVLKNTDTTNPYIWTWNTSSYGNGSHTIKVIAYDTINQTSQTQINVIANNVSGDNPPTVSITSPSNGTSIKGTVNVSAFTSDDHGVTKVEFYLDQTLQRTVNSAPWTWAFNSTVVSDSTHTLKAIAYDTVNQTANNVITVIVHNVDASPNVLIKNLLNDSSISGNTKISVNATDDYAVSKVEFYVDDMLRYTKTSTPYDWSWDTSGEKNDHHIIKVKAYDTSNQWTEQSITLAISNATSFSKNSVFSYPNPASGNKITFRCFTPSATTIKIKIYNVVGELISELSGPAEAGKDNEITWDISEAAPGVYIYVAEADGNKIVKKLTIAK